MANEKKAKKGKTFKVGVNLAPKTEGGEERRYEAGDPVPADITKDELKALADAIEE